MQLRPMLSAWRPTMPLAVAHAAARNLLLPTLWPMRRSVTPPPAAHTGALEPPAAPPPSWGRAEFDFADVVHLTDGYPLPSAALATAHATTPAAPAAARLPRPRPLPPLMWPQPPLLRFLPPLLRP